MAYTAAADSSPSLTAAPAIASLQRALVWLVGACGAIVFIEPSPYEFATLAAIIIFFATGLRLRLVFMPLLLLLFLVNIGYTIGAVLSDGQGRDRQLDRDLVVHGGHRDLLRHGDVRRHRGAARPASPRTDRGRLDRGASPASPAISTSCPADTIC